MLAHSFAIPMPRRARLAVSALPCLPVLLALFVQPAAAQVFRWEDDSGNLHYASAPPPDAKQARNFRQLAEKAPVTRKSARSAEQAAAKLSQREAQETREVDERVAALERELSAERAARQLADMQAQASLMAYRAEAQPQAGIPYVSGIVYAPAMPLCGSPPMRPCDRHQRVLGEGVLKRRQDIMRR